MVRIVLNEEQVRVLSESEGEVQLVDGTGRPVGYVERTYSREELEEAKRRSRSEGPWYTTEEVLQHLLSLDAGS